MTASRATTCRDCSTPETRFRNADLFVFFVSVSGASEAPAAAAGKDPGEIRAIFAASPRRGGSQEGSRDHQKIRRARRNRSEVTALSRRSKGEDGQLGESRKSRSFI